MTVASPASLTIDASTLRDALALIGPAVPARSPKPILVNARLTASPDQPAWLTATDLEITVRVQLPVMLVDEPTSLLLPVARFNQILATVGDDDVVIEVGDKTRISAGGGRWNIDTEDPDLYPSQDFPPLTDAHTVDADALRNAIRRAEFCTDAESTRYALGGVLLEPGKDSLGLVGTDGRRLSRDVIEATLLGNGCPEQTVSVASVKALRLIDRLAAKNDGPVRIGLGKTTVTVELASAVVISRLVEGRFPRYQDVFPPVTAETATVTVRVGALAQAVAQAAVTTNEESRGVDLSWTTGDAPTLRMISHAADVGDSESVCALDAMVGEPGLLTLDPRYLAQVLRVLDPQGTLRIQAISEKYAVVMSLEGERFEHVIMPLTRER